MTFHLGQKVVCVRDMIGQGENQCRWPDHIRAGGIYTVRDVDARLPDVLFLRLEEYVAGILHCRGMIHGPFEPAFNSKFFRPAVEKKTDISIFTKLLTPTPQRRELVSSVNGEGINVR